MSRTRAHSSSPRREQPHPAQHRTRASPHPPGTGCCTPQPRQQLSAPTSASLLSRQRQRPLTSPFSSASERGAIWRPGDCGDCADLSERKAGVEISLLSVEDENDTFRCPEGESSSIGREGGGQRGGVILAGELPKECRGIHGGHRPRI